MMPSRPAVIYQEIPLPSVQVGLGRTPDGGRTALRAIRTADETAMVAEDDSGLIDPLASVHAFATTATPPPIGLSSPPAHGTVRALASGQLRYLPAPDYHGTDVFTYAVLPPGLPPMTTSVAIDVLAANDTPRAANDTFTVGADQPGVLDVVGNDAGIGDGGLRVVVTAPPAHGTAVIDGTRSSTTCRRPASWAPTARLPRHRPRRRDVDGERGNHGDRARAQAGGRREPQPANRGAAWLRGAAAAPHRSLARIVHHAAGCWPHLQGRTARHLRCRLASLGGTASAARCRCSLVSRGHHAPRCASGARRAMLWRLTR